MYTSIRDEYVSYFVAANTALGTGMRRLDLPQQCDGRDAFSAEKERCVCVYAGAGAPPLHVTTPKPGFSGSIA